MAVKTIGLDIRTDPSRVRVWDRDGRRGGEETESAPADGARSDR